MVETEAEARRTLVDAGYAAIEVHLATRLADELRLPQPLLDASLFLVGKRG